VLRSRQRGQSVVEFGIVAILFTLLMFAVVDFGLLLNSWVAISSGTRQVARATTVGFLATDLTTMVSGLNLPGVSRTPYSPFASYCCGSGGSDDEIVLTVRDTLGAYRRLMHIPVRMMLPPVFLMEHLMRNPMVTLGQLKLLEKNNITRLDSVRHAFGFDPARFADNADYLNDY